MPHRLPELWQARSQEPSPRRRSSPSHSPASNPGARSRAHARRTSDLPIPFRAVLLLRPLHYGTFGGMFTRVLWIFLGLTPAVLFVTGFVIWRQRIAAIVTSTR